MKLHILIFSALLLGACAGNTPPGARRSQAASAPSAAPLSATVIECRYAEACRTVRP